MREYPSVAINVPEILIPAKNIDFQKWSVVACDQFTSQPEYWKEVENFIGDSPSTFNIILPEAYLGSIREETHARRINPNMEQYLAKNILSPLIGMIYIERTFDESSRKGLIAAIDLEQYDYSANSKSLIRATEGTIVDRLPPRIKIRENALLEVPHVLVLIDDPENTVLEPITQLIDSNDIIYDFDLMQKSGHLKGFHISKSEIEEQIINALEALKSPEVQSKKYGTDLKTPPLLFAMGDGNHSLATAKAVWEKNKNKLPSNHPSRYPLVEIINLHDDGLEFEAIHRLIIGGEINLVSSLQKYFNDQITCQRVATAEEMISAVIENQTNNQVFGIINEEEFQIITINAPNHTLTVGSVQNWIDELQNKNFIDEVDYIHGDDTIVKLGANQGKTGIFLPAMRKDFLFQSVIKDGPLPRKTFSMGEAHQKRFYLECRKIK